MLHPSVVEELFSGRKQQPQLALWQVLRAYVPIRNLQMLQGDLLKLRDKLAKVGLLTLTVLTRGTFLAKYMKYQALLRACKLDKRKLEYSPRRYAGCTTMITLALHSIAVRESPLFDEK